MRVPYALMVILCAKISSSAISREQRPSRNDLLLSPGLRSISQTSNPNSFGNMNESLAEFFGKYCGKQGGPGSKNAVKKCWEYLIACIQSVVNIRQLKADTAAALSRGKWDAYFGHDCRKVPTFVDSCLTSDGRKFFDAMHKLTSLFLELICYNDTGSNAASFMNTGGLECLSSNSEALELCASGVFGGYASMVDVLKISPFNLGSKDCTDVEELRICAVTVMQKCRSPGPARAVESLFDFYKRMTPCQNILGAQAATDILSSTVAPERIPASPDERFESVSDLLIITGLDNLRRSGVSDQVIESYLREKCERNGGPRAYDVAKKIPRQISGLSISLALHLKMLQAELSLLQRDRRLVDPDTLFDSFCGKISFVEEELNNFEDSAKPCLDPEDREEMETVHNMTSRFLEFFCDHRGDFIATFRTAGGLDCWISKYKAMLNCFVQSPSSHIPWSRSLPQRDSEMRNLERCILEVYEQCDDLTPAKLVRSLIDHSAEASPCKSSNNPRISSLTDHRDVTNVESGRRDVSDSQVPIL